MARALVLRPQVLLFDEPLSNLDARLRRQMREEIRELQRRLGLMVVYVTHDLRPESITIERQPAPADGLAGTITKASYIGSHMEYAVATVAGSLFAISPRVDRPSNRAKR